MARPSQALIDLQALRHNYQLARALAPNSKALAVIKANAYGHGALPVARALADLAPAFAVSCTEEAMELRAGGIQQPILLMSGFFSADELVLAATHNLWLMLENQRQIDQLVAARLPGPVRAWLKVDTGMSRLGIRPEHAATLYEILKNSPNTCGEVVLATHFACADELDNDFTRVQIERLTAIGRKLKAPLSMANSPALLGWPESHGDWNRPGYMLYGATPFPHPHPEADKLIPVMTFASRVISLRTLANGDAVGYGATWRATSPALIATIPVGYGDGYPRNAPSGTPVLVNGQRAQLAGRVSMDLITVDVSGLEAIVPGAEVELWGRHLRVAEVAAKAGTIGYELLTRMPARVRRVYEG